MVMEAHTSSDWIDAYASDYCCRICKQSIDVMCAYLSLCRMGLIGYCVTAFTFFAIDLHWFLPFMQWPGGCYDISDASGWSPW